MNINWFTVIAQVINFLVLVWLLKRFLYKPILNAIDEREKKIAGQLKDADDKKAAALKEQDDFNKKNADFDQQRKALMDKVITDTNTQRDKLLQDAKDEANALRTTLEKTLKDDQQNDVAANADNTQKQVIAITKKLLNEMASTGLEEQAVNTFIKRLSRLLPEEKKQLTDAFKTTVKPATGMAAPFTVRSAFALSAPQQASIIALLEELLATKCPVQFTTAPELINGIELTTNGYKLAWSFADYLQSLQNNLDELKKSKPTDKAEPTKVSEANMNGVPVNK